MRKLLTLAAAGGALLLAAPAQADAAPYLSISEAKRYMREDVRWIVRPAQFTVDRCYRLGWSLVECRWTSYTNDGLVCASADRQRKTSTGVWFRRGPGRVECW